MPHRTLFTTACLLFASMSVATGDQHHPPAAGAMGFDQDKTIHHFRLLSTGGSIDVEVKDRADHGNLHAIHTHLQDLAADFSKGVFDKPFITHGQEAPGTATMRALKDRLEYVFEATETGGRVRISTRDAEARAAVHEFLRYQIREHRTGDPLTVER
jgi:hypothetical protein